VAIHVSVSGGQFAPVTHGTERAGSYFTAASGPVNEQWILLALTVRYIPI